MKTSQALIMSYEHEQHITLEIGCGVAPILKNAPREFVDEFKRNDQMHYIGIDQNGTDIGYIELVLKKELKSVFGSAMNRISFIVADATDLSFENESVDRVIMKNVLGDPAIERRHVLKSDAKKKMLDEAHRVLKKNGELVVHENTTPSVAREGKYAEYANFIFGLSTQDDTGEIWSPFSIRYQKRDREIRV